MHTFKIDRPAAILEGGPRSGWGYYVEDLWAIVRAGERTGRIFPYRPTDRYVEHPGSDPATESQVWEYAPIPF